MKFAIVNGFKVATEDFESSILGICRCCGAPVRSHMKNNEREIRIRDFNNHWKHINKKMCDTWWENETEWHRSWKNNFPKEWQEYIMHDNITGEKHIADIYTLSRDNKIVIEIQNSKISESEIKTREQFYKNIIWLVNGNSFGLELGEYIDIEEYTNSQNNKMKKEYYDLKQYISSFYDKYSGEASSYKTRRVPFEHIDLIKCLDIERYSQHNSIAFKYEFYGFKKAVQDFPEYEKKYQEYKGTLERNGYVGFFFKNNSIIWSTASAPVYFDIDDKLYKLEKKYFKYDYGFNEKVITGGVLKIGTHEHFVNHFTEKHSL